jgi:hypothetical protein
MPDQESSQTRKAWSAGWREDIEHPAKPSAAIRSRPLWSGIVRSAADRSPARTRHPDSVAIDAAIKLTAVLVLLEEGV